MRRVCPVAGCQGPTLHPCPPEPLGACFPDPAFLLPNLDQSLHQQASCEVPRQEGRGLWLLLPFRLAEAGHPPVCGPDRAFSLVCRRLGPRGQVGWRRQQAAEEDASRENLTLPSDATFPQSLESKCWIFVSFSLMGGKYKNSYYFHNFLKFGVTYWCVSCSRSAPKPS